jgi:hypothetical protein
MFTLRCTRKLLTRMRVKPALEPPPSTTRLGDWYADTLNLGRERLVLCVSELTLLPVVMPAIGVGVDLNAKLARGLRQTLESLGAPTAAIDIEVNQLLKVTIAKTASRVVLGTMNDFQFMVRHIRNQHRTASLLDLGLELADTPCGPIDGCPTDAALAALSGTPTRSKPRRRFDPPPSPSAPNARAITNAPYEESCAVRLKYYLVVQWKNSEMTLDDVIEMERSLELRLSQAGLSAKFSGNDVGTNEMNLFVRCDDPARVFNVIRGATEQSGQFVGVRAAYRLPNGENYTAVWPADMADFEVS